MLTINQTIFLTIIGCGSFLLYLEIMINIVGSFDELFYLLLSRAVSTMAGRAYVGVLTYIVIIVTAMIAHSHFRAKVLGVRSARRLMFYFMFAVSLIMLIVLGGRGAVLQFLLLILIICYSCRGDRVRVSIRLLSFVLISVIVVVVGLAVRHSMQKKVSFYNTYNELSGNLVQTIISQFALFDHYMLAKKYVDINGYDYGEQYFAYLSRPIPRSIWPEKPTLLGIKIREEFWGDTQGGITPTVFGEFYTSFGYFGLIAGSAFIGYLIRFLEQLYQRSLVKSDSSVLYGILTVNIIFTMVRSGLEIAFVNILIYIALISVINIMLRLRLKVTTQLTG
jgi:oligosaccharide repeat unit polymerase